MANETGGQIRARIQPALDQPIQVVVGLWGDQNAPVPFVLKRLDITQQVAADFRTAGDAHLDDVAGSHIVPFAPGYTPDPQGAAEIFRLNREDFDYPELVDRILNPAGLPPFDLGKDKHIAFHCFVVRRGNVRAGFLHKAATVLLARKGIWGVLVENRVERLTTEVLTFSTAVDILLEPNVLWISNVATHRSLFRNSQVLLNAIATNVQAVVAVVAIVNAQAFEEACRRDPGMMAKLAQVSAKAYLQALTPQAIAAVVAGFHLPPAVLDAQGRLVHDNSPARRWLILKILDDSYLRSTMTNEQYEVNSKLEV